jgi:hypothetical protein
MTGRTEFFGAAAAGTLAYLAQAAEMPVGEVIELAVRDNLTIACRRVEQRRAASAIRRKMMTTLSMQHTTPRLTPECRVCGSSLSDTLTCRCCDWSSHGPGY